MWRDTKPSVVLAARRGSNIHGDPVLLAKPGAPGLAAAALIRDPGLAKPARFENPSTTATPYLA